MDNMIVTLLLVVLAALLGFFAWRFYSDASTLRARYSSIIDVEAEANAAKRALAQTQREQAEVVASTERQKAQLSHEYDQARSVFDSLKKEVSLLEENLEDISFGFYKPHFTFQTSEEYKAKLEAVWEREKALIRDGKAAVCATTWTVSGSAKDGARMSKQYLKLMLRAFNGECDAAVAKVSWNNITKMEERLRKSFSVLNDLGGVMQMSITPEYLNLKLDELRLTHEYEEKKYQEREEQRRIREQIREEERAQRELDKAREQAEQEEVRYQKALEKARAEAAAATGAQLEKLTRQIESFESKLDEAKRVKERAVSRAQLTKSGFVYVISNVGSFGDRVFKIGMTRRMEPMERISELGDASVPFPFDLHAMLYSDNAPELENALHEYLAEKRVNLVNPRREFYFDVDLDDVEAFVHKRGLSAQFMKLVEAKEYRESLALRAQQASQTQADKDEGQFPATLFGSDPAQGESKRASAGG